MLHHAAPPQLATESGRRSPGPAAIGRTPSPRFSGEQSLLPVDDKAAYDASLEWLNPPLFRWPPPPTA